MSIQPVTPGATGPPGGLGVVRGGVGVREHSAELKTQLTEQGGMSSEQADCIVDGLNSRGVPLDQYDQPSAGDQAKITEAVTECVLADTGISVPTTP